MSSQTIKNFLNFLSQNPKLVIGSAAALAAASAAVGHATGIYSIFNQARQTSLMKQQRDLLRNMNTRTEAKEIDNSPLIVKQPLS